MITLTLNETLSVPLEAEQLSPDVVALLSNDAIKALPVMLGRRRRRVGDFFAVEGEASDDLEIRGDAGRIKWIGRGMTRGRISIAGNAGMHLGAHMKGGAIDVSGNVSDWLGAQMSGGLIRIRGNAGGQAGAAYRGSRSGMTDGTILIEGSAGVEVGMRMKRGIIAIGGTVGDLAGLEMKGGTIVVGDAERRTGTWMVRGTIISLRPIPLLPTFSLASTYIPTFLRLYARHLATLGFSLPFEGGTYHRYVGDASVPGRGEILMWQPHTR